MTRKQIFMGIAVIALCVVTFAGGYLARGSASSPARISSNAFVSSNSPTNTPAPYQPTYTQPGVPMQVPTLVRITRNSGATTLPALDALFTDQEKVQQLWTTIWNLPFEPVASNVQSCPDDTGLSYVIDFGFSGAPAHPAPIEGKVKASGCSGLTIGGRGTLVLTSAFWQSMQSVMGQPALP